MINSVFFIGRLTETPELRSTEDGTAVTTFSIAVDRRFTTQEGERETDFFKVVAWRQNAIFVADHFTKGEMIGIRGRMQNRRYTDKDGNKRTAIEAVAEEISFC